LLGITRQEPRRPWVSGFYFGTPENWNGGLGVTSPRPDAEGFEKHTRFPRVQI
jgi:hypothetical protein